VYLDFTGNPLHAGHPQPRSLRLGLLVIALDLAAQRDDAVLDRHADPGGVDARFPLQFVQHLLLQHEVGLHGAPPVSTADLFADGV
jgi:hypothetical protein